MTQPLELERGDGIVYREEEDYKIRHRSWNGWRGKVLSVDKGTTPWEFVRIRLDSPWDDDWHPITWTERENLRKLPTKKAK